MKFCFTLKSFFFLALSAFSVSCSVPQKSVLSEPLKAQKILINGDSRNGTYISKPRGFSTATYWIEGPTGLIMIDTQFLLSAAAEAIDWAEETTGKKVVLAVVLHPNPDKFNGTGEFKKRGIKVISSQQVIELIPEVHKDRYDSFYERFKPDYPENFVFPESFGQKTTEIEAGGIKIKLHVLGPACSGAHVVAEFDKHIFVGDMIANLGHSWLELGLVDEWLKRMNELGALKPEFVHPGRGPSGGAELIEREKIYLNRVKKYVLEAKPRKKISEEELENVLEKIQARLEKDYPGYSEPYFAEIGLPEVWNKLAR